jgi:serine/threonine-protein kinase
VFDYGQTSHGDPFIVSEMLEGKTLADRVDEEGAVPAAQAVQMVLPVIDGLAMAHATGIVHRDVKSENIFLARDLAGRVQPKLLDFGVARYVHDDKKITVDGSLLGTADYMSPEQARGEGGSDHHTDIWSMCVVLYELLTARMPFSGNNYNAVLWAIVNEPVKPITDLGAGNSALWKLLERGLRKEPLERWGSMRELGVALALWLYERGVREDICGSSLRATWLEPGAEDSVPISPTDPPVDLAHLEEASGSFAPPSSGPASSSPASSAVLTPKGRHRLLLVVSLVAAGLIALGAWIGMALQEQAPATADQAQRKASTSTPSASNGLSPSAAPSTESKQNSDEAAKADAGDAAEEPEAAPARSKVRRPRKPWRRTPKTPKTSKSPKKVDFGF